MTPRAMGDGAEHDAWLREALRHAPDAEMTAPPAVSDAILRQARSATAPPSMAPTPATGSAPRRNRRNFWREPSVLWSWLARPAAATGFASVMVATLVGLMWWNRPMDEALPHSPAVAQPPVALATAPEPDAGAAPPPPAVATATAPFPPTASTEVARAAARGKSFEARSSVASANKAMPTDAALATPAPRAAGPSTQLPNRRQQDLPSDERKSIAGEVADAVPPAAPRTATTPDSPSPIPAQRPAPVAAGAATDQPGRAAEREAMAPSRARAELTARPSAAPAPEQRSPSQAAPDTLRMSADRAAKPVANAAPATTSSLSTRADAPGAASPLTALRAALSSSPQRWVWQRDAGPQQAMNPAIEGWLSQLDASVRLPWRPAAQVQVRESAAAPAAGSGMLRLWRDGQLHAVLRVGDEVARLDVIGEAASAWQASISAIDAAALIKALDEATR